VGRHVASAVESIIGDADPFVRWRIVREEAASIAASHVPVDGSVDVTNGTSGSSQLNLPVSCGRDG